MTVGAGGVLAGTAGVGVAGEGDVEDGVEVDPGDVGELDDVSDDVGPGDVVSSGEVVSLVVGVVDVGFLWTSVRGTHV